ncbi:MAG TPA: polysaccharide lyase family protein [Candidatus Acidoferrum sp.]|nr:polysaccharide lyase family protein [Candidatus Acidoferrum sp.]
MNLFTFSGKRFVPAACAALTYPKRYTRQVTRRILLGAALWLSCLAGSTLANNPGGFTPLVTTPVTTGTEAFGSRTDRYLDNGILHVLIATNGNVDSIKYLKPGLPGTPKANGTEMVSQSGVNFGNHTAIYYYWYPDGNGDAAYLSTTASSTNIDLGYQRTFNPALHAVAANVELHYVLGQGNTGLYVYLVVRHPSSFTYTNVLNISFIQAIWPTAHDTTNFLCENQYLDDSVKYGLILNGVRQKRNGLQPNFWDNYHTASVPGLPVEVVQYTTGLFNGSTNGKYSFTLDYPKLDTFGMASDVNPIGLWIVTGGHDYQNNGPTACEYAGGIGGLVLFEPLIAHYGNTGLTVSSNADFNKIYGPWLCYFNSLSNGAASWQDARNQAAAEQQAWPYAWLTNSSLYQPKNQRATVTGRLVISDPFRPQANAAGAWVGLAAPDTGTENATNNWQLQSDGYQFWTQCAADGTFTLPPVTTFSPYGGAATYQLYAYGAGTNGSVGEFRAGPYTFAPGTVTNLGTLTWTVPHQGSNVLWEIGYPDRTAAEFRHGDEYSIPGLWQGFSGEFSNPLLYTVGTSNWTNDWNYVQSAYWVGNVSNNWVWTIQFNLPRVPAGGNATLNTVWAGAYSAAIQVYVNDPNRSGAVFRDFYPSVPAGANSLMRQGIHDKYGIDHTSIPVSKFVAGTNTITLIQRRAMTSTSTYVMYDYVNLELPSAAAPVALTATAGDAQVTLTWTASPGATGYNVRRSTTEGGAYDIIASPGTTNFLDATAGNGTNYFYVVSALNAFGESADSAPASARPVSPVPPRLDFSFTGGQLQLSWPATNTGWRLEAQTNSLAIGLGQNWVTVSGSNGTNQMFVSLYSVSGTVFFRLVYP